MIKIRGRTAAMGLGIKASLCATLALALGTGACGGEQGSASANTDVEDSSSVAATSKPLMVLETDTGTRIEVREDSPGVILIGEQGEVDVDPVVTTEIAGNGLVNMVKQLAPRLKKPLDSVGMKTLVDADARAELHRKTAQALGKAEKPVQLERETLLPAAAAQGVKTPNFYEYNGDELWFRQNFCKPGSSFTCETWLYWVHSGPKYGIKDGTCTVLNAANTGIATIKYYKQNYGWIIWGQANVPARTWYRYTPGNNHDPLDLACEGDGVNGSFVSVGFYWTQYVPPAPTPPPASCGPYIYRAQTNGCTNGDGTPSTLKICADGCGSTPQQAQDSAAYSLATRVCLGSGAGCCNVTFDQNFNWCGY